MRSAHLLLSLLLLIRVVAQDKPDPRSVLSLVQADLAEAGFSDEDLSDVVVKDHYVTGYNGVQHTFIRQRVQGIEVWNGDIAVHRLPDGRILKVNNGAYPHLADRVNAVVPGVGADLALGGLLAREGLPMPGLVQSTPDGHTRSYDGTAFGGSPVTVQLMLWPMDSLLRLVWSVDFSLPDGAHWWDVKVDALTGAELDRQDRTLHCTFGAVHGCSEDPHDHELDLPEEDLALPLGPNSYRVYAPPVESPNHGPRTVVTMPWLSGGIASPYGWHDTNGASGAEYTYTRGNNVLAQEDQDGDNTTNGYRPSGGATLDFDFPIDLAQAPSTYLDASITNLFFWNNHLHDVLYNYGFNEASGNFQQNNYGRGGIAADAVFADAQDGYGMVNANFGTGVDGVPPRMQMFLWDLTAPYRSGDLENGVIAHEYAHGLSIRLVGGASNVTCLNNAEQMGEGWSDYIGLMLTMKATDTRTDPRGIGTYVIGQPISGPGIRPAPYTTNMGQNPYTYASTNISGGLWVPHGIGFVWCTMLWEMTWDLIDLYGFDPDMFSGSGGNNIAMRLVIDGMKLTPCSPGFVDARDAILAADQATYNGAHGSLIRAAFARRGLGWFASQGATTSRDDQVASFVATPVAQNVGVLSIDMPGLTPQLDCAPYSVSVKVRNNGTAVPAPFNVSYQLDNGTVHTVLYSSALAAGATATVTFPAAPVNVTLPGTYQIRAFTALAGDQVPGDDEYVRAFTVAAGQGLPHQAVPTAAEPFPPDWSQEAPISFLYGWTTRAVTHGSSCQSDIVWRKSGAGSTPTERRFLSPFFVMPSSGGPYLRFFHAYVPSTTQPNAPVALRVDVTTDCGVTWTSVFQETAPTLATAPSSSTGDLTSCQQWQLNTVDLTAFQGETVRFRFAAVEATGGGVLYLDDIRIQPGVVPVELALGSLTSPPADLDLYCPGLSQPVTVNLFNLGTLPQSGFTVSYRVNGGSWITEPYTGTISPATGATYTFTQLLTFAQPGPNLLEAVVNITDANPVNNSRSMLLDLVTMNPVVAPTQLEFNAEDGILIPPDWKLSNLDGADTWENVSIGTGIYCSTTRVWRLDHHVYEAAQIEDRLVMPSYQLTAQHRATLRFDHAYAPHTDPARVDGFRVEITQDCGATWTTLFEQFGSDLGTATPTASAWVPTNCSQWRPTAISLEDYDGEVIMVRFAAVNGNGNRFYLDNIRIDQVPYVNAKVNYVFSPTIDPLVDCGGMGVPVTVEVTNSGAFPITDIPLRYQVDNGPWVNAVVAGPFASNAGAPFTFAQSMMGLAPGVHEFTVETQVPGDQRPWDDDMNITFEVLPSTLVLAPYYEGLDGGVTVPPGWTLENPDGQSTWSSSVLSIGTACVSSRAWTRNFVGDANWGEEDRLVSPQIDLSGMNDARLKFYHAYSINPNAGQSSDQLRVEVSADCGLTWSTVFTRSGSAMATAPNSTVTPWVPTNCSQWSLNTVDLSAYDGQTIQLRFVSVNGNTGRLYMDNVQVMNEELTVSIKVFLDGPYVSATQLMNDILRVQALIPTTEPFTALGFDRVADNGPTTVPPSMLTTTGNNAVVDWVFVELRSPNAPYDVLATRCLLLQRDGDVIRTDLASTQFKLPGNPGQYRIAVRHRNHLGIMTANPLTLSTSSAPIDLTLPATATYGTDARKAVATRMTMWAGNAVPDAQVKYTGAANDRDPILQAVGGTVPTNTITGYSSSDLNLDGTVKYTGTANDRDIILQAVGGSVPTNFRLQQLP